MHTSKAHISHSSVHSDGKNIISVVTVVHPFCISLSNGNNLWKSVPLNGIHKYLEYVTTSFYNEIAEHKWVR